AIWIIKSPAPITLGATRPAGLFTLRLPNIGRYLIVGVPPEWLTMAGWFAISGLIWILLRNDIRALPENQRAMLISGRA
ncbi:hypothetical protein, partial [Sphingosinicella microcystinivorans]